ncbi:MAG: LysM peptidoglycan-binding domain-containing protein [Clostridiales bacterium]|nr:LysM peptidoglycan-binding domain-containing protein [Clostridiales bacterium]
MKTESVVIHKGRKDEKYQIYVEDYVISYLKYETGSLELSEIFFYGYGEKNEKEYTLYGAGRDKQLAVFNKYDLLEKITCRLTQGGPVFMVRETEGLYEVKGYHIFYDKNEEMQNYLIERKQQYRTADEEDRRWKQDSPCGQEIPESANLPGKHLHNAMSLQMGVIFVILVAIVINSSNSYDKMEQLNQSAQEVFFAIENQEAEEETPVEEIPEEIVVERDSSAEYVDETVQEEILQPLPDADTTEEEGQEDAEESGETDSISAETANTRQQDTEALSRNVTRYYEIKRGDTLYTISKDIYGDISKVQEICELNQISDPDNIRYGQKIILP